MKPPDLGLEVASSDERNTASTSKQCRDKVRTGGTAARFDAAPHVRMQDKGAAQRKTNSPNEYQYNEHDWSGK